MRSGRGGADWRRRHAQVADSPWTPSEICSQEEIGGRGGGYVGTDVAPHIGTVTVLALRCLVRDVGVRSLWYVGGKISGGCSGEKN